MAFRLWTIALLCLAASGCASPEAQLVSTATYENPVLDADFPDPSVIRAPEGFYYGYATQTQRDGKWILDEPRIAARLSKVR